MDIMDEYFLNHSFCLLNFISSWEIFFETVFLYRFRYIKLLFFLNLRSIQLFNIDEKSTCELIL